MCLAWGAENTAYARHFIGQSYLNPLTNPESGLFLANVISTTQKKAAGRC